MYSSWRIALLFVRKIRSKVEERVEITAKFFAVALAT